MLLPFGVEEVLDLLNPGHVTGDLPEFVDDLQALLPEYPQQLYYVVVLGVLGHDVHRSVAIASLLQVGVRPSQQ
ncbi:MAG: hypothetical protein ACMG6E_06790 [Candidatus Roizmanbacteria bacterium]